MAVTPVASDSYAVAVLAVVATVLAPLVLLSTRLQLLPSVGEPTSDPTTGGTTPGTLEPSGHPCAACAGLRTRPRGCCSWRLVVILRKAGNPAQSARAAHVGGYANTVTPVPEDGTLDGGSASDGLIGLREDLDPDAYAAHAAAWLTAGATVVGGCCGTRPTHIARLRALIDARVETTPARKPTLAPGEEPVTAHSSQAH